MHMHPKTLIVIYFDRYGLYEYVAITIRLIPHMSDDIHTNPFVPLYHYLYIYIYTKFGVYVFHCISSYTYDDDLILIATYS